MILNYVTTTSKQLGSSCSQTVLTNRQVMMDLDNVTYTVNTHHNNVVSTEGPAMARWLRRRNLGSTPAATHMWKRIQLKLFLCASKTSTYISSIRCPIPSITQSTT